MSFKSLLENKPTRKPTTSRGKTSSLVNKPHRQKIQEWNKKYEPERYKKVVKRAGRLKRRRVVSKGVQSFKESWYRPSAVKERKAITRSFKKGGRKILRKLI